MSLGKAYPVLLAAFLLGHAFLDKGFAYLGYPPSYVGELGLAADFFVLRDGVAWAYSTFAILVAGVLLRTGLIERVLNWYGRWLSWFLLWAPIGFLIGSQFGDAFPVVPGSHVTVLTLKADDRAIHLVGAAAILALGPHHGSRGVSVRGRGSRSGFGV